MRKKDVGPTEIWTRYEKGVEHHRRLDLYQKTEQAYRFFLGEQWYGMQRDGQDLPVMNIVAPTIKNKVATIAKNTVNICYTPIGGDESRSMQQTLCARLSEFARCRWEQFKLDTHCWNVIKDACIAGDSYLYFYDADGRAEVLDNTNVYLGDEQCTDIQRQPYILIYERRNVRDVIADAKKNGIPADQIALIRADEDTENLLSEQSRAEVGTDGGKCTCLVQLSRDEEGFVHITRSTKTVVYQPDTALTAHDYTGNVTRGLTLYPIVSFVWQRVKGSARGMGEVWPLVANQVEINKTLARRAISVKSFAFPKLVYDRARVENPDSLTEVGSSIAVDNLSGTDVSGLISYLNPVPISSAAEKLTAELIANTRDLAGAGDASTGSINPEKASGAAILAVRDLSQLPLNEQIAAFRQFVEDVAAIWYELWCVYNPSGLTVTLSDGTVYNIPTELFDTLKVGIRVDVSSDSPYSRYAQQQALDNLFAAGAISFEEYVEVLDDASALPKGRLEEILRLRRTREQSEALSGGAMGVVGAMTSPAGVGLM